MLNSPHQTWRIEVSAQHKETSFPTNMETCPPVSIVIVTYNSASVLPGLLDSLLLGLDGVDDFEVVIVDNDSKDDCIAISLAHPVGPKVVRMGRNAGYAAGINAASASIQPDRNILILNPDIRLLPGSVRQLLDSLADPTIGVAVPQMLNEDGTLAQSLRRDPSIVTAWSDALLGSKIAARAGVGEIVYNPHLYRQGGAIEWSTGAALLVAARARHTVGDWDESFFLYSEEVDFLQRVRRHGLSVTYVPRSQVMHIGGEYHRNSVLSALMTSNRIRYYRRQHGRIATAIFRLSIIVGSAMRFTLGPGHRAALRAAMTPTRP
jgi:N-acetylglucosaminyl-diphospho-decaprenol L-rhamnosyltransferase